MHGLDSEETGRGREDGGGIFRSMSWTSPDLSQGTGTCPIFAATNNHETNKQWHKYKEEKMGWFGCNNS